MPRRGPDTFGRESLPPAVAQAQAQLMAAPAYQAAIDLIRTGASGDQLKRAFGQAITQSGVRIPKGYVPNIYSGKLTYEPQHAPWWTYPLIGAAFAAPELANLFSGGGGPAAVTGGGASGTAATDTLASTPIGPTAASLRFGAPTLAATGGRSLARAASDRGGSLTNAAVAGLAGLPGLIGARGGPSQQEQALQAQIQALLKQQEGRTTYQEPLFRALTQMAAGLQPRLYRGKDHGRKGAAPVAAGLQTRLTNACVPPP